MFFSSVTERFFKPPEATSFTGNGLASAEDLVTQNRVVFQLNRSADVRKNVTGGGGDLLLFSTLIFPPRVLQIDKDIGWFGCSCLEGTEHRGSNVASSVGLDKEKVGPSGLTSGGAGQELEKNGITLLIHSFFTLSVQEICIRTHREDCR